MIREFNDEPTGVQFAREQAVQHAIALIQKIARVSIFDIDEEAIRVAVRLGRQPSVIARQWVRERATTES